MNDKHEAALVTWLRDASRNKKRLALVARIIMNVFERDDLAYRDARDLVSREDIWGEAVTCGECGDFYYPQITGPHCPRCERKLI